ncbi:MAG: ADP-ribosylation factor-like protein, partial [Asgard group archaeon]|nr:ADP-ribosylation factor-like protein [Asgard group archaeon]
MNFIKSSISDAYEKKIFLAIIGLSGVGKTTFINRLIQTNDYIEASISKISQMTLYSHANLSILTWDLETNGQYIENKFWQRFVKKIDALYYIIDSTKKEQLTINKKLIIQLRDLPNKIRILFLASKADLPDSLTINQLHKELSLEQLLPEKESLTLQKYSIKTGEGLFQISEWFDNNLIQKKGRIVEYITIWGCFIFNITSLESSGTFLRSQPHVSTLTAYKETQKRLIFFSRRMREQQYAEEVLKLGSYKAVILKEQPIIVALLLSKNDFVPRAIEIAKNLKTIVTASVL